VTATAIAWTGHADNLATWAWNRLVNRLDAWGGYRNPEEWGKEFRRKDGTTGKMGQTTTHKGHLTQAVLARHFRAGSRAALIGLHSTSQANTCRWGALDIDYHGPTSTNPEINLRAALAWHDGLATAGFHPLLIDSNGAGGFHLFIMLASPAPAAGVYDFLKHLIADHARHGMAAPPETFPKQPLLRPRPDGSPGFGNWLRVPGQHHTREHWSRVWAGERWLDGAEAVAYLLNLTGDSPELIPELLPRPAPVPTPRRWHAPVASPGDNRTARVAAYLRRLPNLGEGQGRDDVAYHFACFLVRDMALPDDEALDWLQRWDAANNPPKGVERLQEILASAHRYGRNQVGCGLTVKHLQRRRRGHHKTTILHFTVRI